MKSFVAKALMEAVVLTASHTLSAKTFAAFWKRVSPRLQEGVSYIDRHEDEGLEVEKTLLEAITFRDPEITRIIDACLKEFLHSDVLALIDQVQRIQDGINERREQINVWKLATIAAPATSLMPLKQTRASLNRRIARERKAIEADEARIEKLKETTLASMASRGLAMTPEQLDGLLYSAEGGDLAQVMAVAENIRAIETNLSAELKGPEAGAAQVRAYTGYVTMSYRVYLAAIDRARKTIESVYIKRLETIIAEATSQMMKADALRQSLGERSEVAMNNLDLNSRTIDLADLYEKHLQRRLEDLERLAGEMKINYELARNTFRTVKVGGELVDVIRAGEKDLRSIFEFEPPKLEAFYDKKLREEFDAITAELKAPRKGRRH